MIEQKQWHWKRCRQLRHTMRIAVMREIFGAWQHGSISEDETRFRPWLRLSDQALALHLWAASEAMPYGSASRSS